MDCRQADGRSRVAPKRFSQYLRRRHPAKFATGCGGLFRVRHDPKISLRNDRLQPRNSFAQHSFVPSDVQKLFGSAHAAARPETRAASARK
jgi:hypothetical protein